MLPSIFHCASFKQYHTKIPGKITNNMHVCKCAYRLWHFFFYVCLSQSLSFTLKHNSFLHASLSVSVPLVQTHTHFVTVYLSLSQSLSFTPHTFCLCLFLSVSVPLVHTPTHFSSMYLSLPQSLSFTHTHFSCVHHSLARACTPSSPARILDRTFVKAPELVARGFVRFVCRFAHCHVAVCDSELQYVAAFCSVMQCDAVSCNGC